MLLLASIWSESPILLLMRCNRIPQPPGGTDAWCWWQHQNQHRQFTTTSNPFAVDSRFRRFCQCGGGCSRSFRRCWMVRVESKISPHGLTLCSAREFKVMKSVPFLLKEAFRAKLISASGEVLDGNNQGNELCAAWLENVGMLLARPRGGKVSKKKL